MATIHRGATLEPSKVELVTAWMPRQRWYTGKGRDPELVRVGGFRLEDPAGRVGIETLLLADTAASPPVVYQVPLTYRDAPLADAEHALVGTAEHSVLGTRWVYDGPHDPAYVSGLVATILGAATSDVAPASHGASEPAHGASTGRFGGVVESSKVLVGEQSNTSVICRMAGAAGEPAEPLIVKVFRTLQDGENPDVVVQSALTDAGCSAVPVAAGSLSGAWDAPGGDAMESGHLAFAQEFIPGVDDAWRTALVAAAAGRDFTTRARDLGVVTAQIHETLAGALGTQAASPAAREWLATSMRERYAAAVAAVPGLTAREAEILAVLDGVRGVEWPLLQRIHGDYHLGQVLDVPERGWVALDFEGEPLRPLSERIRPDLALRDVAGMLRSFDYAAGSVHLADASIDASGWAVDCRSAFLDGYASVAGPTSDADRVLVRALELDKALYEVLYEARNRPTWLPIPTQAVHRLLDEGDPR